MSTNTETLRVTTINVPKLSLYVAGTAALRRWSRRSQLGSPFEAEIGRHTGARC